MPAEWTALLFGFMLVLARVSGVIALTPLPGLQSAPATARVVLSLAITMALFGQWPRPEPSNVDAALLILWVLPEAAIGVATGLAVAFLLEGFLMAAQILSLNAGYSFASTIDPATQAESGVLVVFAQLAGGLLFFALGFDRHVVNALASSLRENPAGAALAPSAAEALLRLGGNMLVLAVRLALPAVALLLLTDMALGLLGRLNAQLQLLTLSFPLKMMASLLVLGWLTALLPRLWQVYAAEVFGTLSRVLRF